MLPCADLVAADTAGAVTGGVVAFGVIALGFLVGCALLIWWRAHSDATRVAAYFEDDHLPVCSRMLQRKGSQTTCCRPSKPACAAMDSLQPDAESPSYALVTHG